MKRIWVISMLGVCFAQMRTITYDASTTIIVLWNEYSLYYLLLCSNSIGANQLHHHFNYGTF